MAETTITKLATGIVHHESSLAISIRSEGRGHRVAKCKNILKATDWPVCTLMSGQHLVSVEIAQSTDGNLLRSVE